MTKANFTLPKYEDIFNNVPAQEKTTQNNVVNIPISLIDDFPNHPFHVELDEDMESLKDSISENGVVTPVLVKRTDAGRYMMISGHRRKMACVLLHKTEIPATVLDVSTEDATVIMVEANRQRTNILPSEKAFAYKMAMDAAKAKRRYGAKEEALSAESVAEEQDTSKNQIYRFIRLTFLNKELLRLVDESKIKIRQAVEISYIDDDSQSDVFGAICEYETYPSYSQAQSIRKLYEDGNLTHDAIYDIMANKKSKKDEKITFKAEKIKPYLPQNISSEETENYIKTALIFYRDHLLQQGKCRKVSP